mmetsp:Transcript_61444/g.126885  ORF Transcript_61444/g.126885 Transcript_61444/m.126885 type:complete len:103 (+) Transcript_61444:994-1302(+)
MGGQGESGQMPQVILESQGDSLSVRVAAQVRMGMEGFNISDQGRRFTQSVAFGRRFEFAELLLVGFKPLAALPNSLLQVLTELTVPLSEDDPCQVTLGRVGQ